MFHVSHLNSERTHVTSTSAAALDSIGTHNQPDLRTTPFLGRALYGDLVQPGPPLKRGFSILFAFQVVEDSLLFLIIARAKAKRETKREVEKPIDSMLHK